MKLKNLLGKFLAHPLIFAAIVAYAERRPYGHLYNKAAVYMYRWSVINVGTWQSSVLKVLTRGKYDHIRLHEIMRPDRDRELHNHPFNYLTFILEGWYREHYEPAAPFDGVLVRHIGKGEWADTNNSHFHRIATVSPGGVTTLFMMGPDKGEWGFKVNGEYLDSREFFRLRKIRNDGKTA